MKDPLLYRLLRPILVFGFKILYWPKFFNKNIILKKGRVLLAGTHISKKDPFILASSTKRCVHFLTKDELTRIWPAFFKATGAISVNRRIKDKSVIPAAVAKLNEDRLIGIFPEGTINRTDEVIMPFKPGVIKMAIESGSPIIPFAITGEYKLFRGRVKIIFGQPYNPKTDDITNEIKVLENKVKKILKEGNDNE